MKAEREGVGVQGHVLSEIINFSHWETCEMHLTRTNRWDLIIIRTINDL